MEYFNEKDKKIEETFNNMSEDFSNKKIEYIGNDYESSKHFIKINNVKKPVGSDGEVLKNIEPRENYRVFSSRYGYLNVEKLVDIGSSVKLVLCVFSKI